MEIYPAVDLYQGKVVRLLKGSYQNITEYSNDPLAVVRDFEEKGAKFLHVVDLDGARTGTALNAGIVREIVENTSLFVEVGGGVRALDTIMDYLRCGVRRVILGTAAVSNPDLLKKAVARFGDAIAVGADIRNGKIAVKGWEEESIFSVDSFFQYLEVLSVKTVICTDISKDGAMQGTNVNLYRGLAKQFPFHLIASGGISSLDDIRQLREIGISGAIIGKAYYTGAIDLRKAIEEAK